MKISTQKNKSLVSKNIGVFAASLLVVVAATYIYSPVIGVNAETTTNVSIKTAVNTIVSVSLDNTSLDFNITPTAAGHFDSNTVTVTVDTNSVVGYELYFSSEDNNTAMTHSDSNISNTIASDFSGTVTSSTMAANKWGYSLDNTNFSKIPAANAQATIKNIDHYPSAAEKTSTVRIGMKLDTTLPSGTYSKSVRFSVLAHEIPDTRTISDISDMQEISPTICSNSILNESNTLTDTRDGNTYTVKKLKDGKCWMTQNLKIVNKTITSSNSDVSADFTIPASSPAGFNTQDANRAYVESNYGGHYTFYTATAGTGGTSLTSGNAPSSICPKGWRLPTGGPYGEFSALYDYYSSPELMRGDPGFVFSGYVDDDGTYVNNNGGLYWSSTIYDANYAYRLGLGATGVTPNDRLKKYMGFSVRCIAR